MEYNFGIDMANYSRFYALLGKLPVHSEGMKEEFVSQYTGGRTTSLRCMTAPEYDKMCDALEDSLSDRNMLRASRSSALRLMQKLRSIERSGGLKKETGNTGKTVCFTVRKDELPN